MTDQNQEQAFERSRIILVPRAHVVNKEKLFNFIRQNSVHAPPRFRQKPSSPEGHVHQQNRNNLQRSQSMRPPQQHSNQPPPPEHQFNRNQSFRTPDRLIDFPGANQLQPLPPPSPSQHQLGPQFPQNQQFQAPQHYPNPANDHFAQHVRNINNPKPKNNGGNSNSFLFSGNFDPNRAPARQVTASVPLFGDNNNRKINNDDMSSPPPRKAPTQNRSQSSARMPPNGSSASNQGQGQQLTRNPLASSPNHLPAMREQESSNRQSNNRHSREVFYGEGNDYEDGSIFVGNQVNDAVASSMLGVSRRNNSLDGIEYHHNFIEEEPEDEEENPNVFFREQGAWIAENLLNGEDLLDGLGGNLGGKAGGMVGAKLGKKLGNEKAGEMLGEFAGDELGDMAGEMAADAAMEALGEMEIPEVGLPDGLEVPDVGLPDGMEKPDMDKLCKGCSIM